MEINLKTYNGLVGDPDLLLIAETDCGIKESVLFNRSYLKVLNYFFAQKKLIRRIKNKRIEIC